MAGSSVPFLVLCLLIIEFLLRKLLFGRFESRIMETDGGSIIKKWTILLVVIGIGFYLFLITGALENGVEKWFWLFFLLFVYGSRTFFEWRYNRRSKEYLLQMILLLTSPLFVLIFLF